MLDLLLGLEIWVGGPAFLMVRAWQRRPVRHDPAIGWVDTRGRRASRQKIARIGGTFD
jgi:hypothetical protein